jgi:hypothetical protein
MTTHGRNGKANHTKESTGQRHRCLLLEKFFLGVIVLFVALAQSMLALVKLVRFTSAMMIGGYLSDQDLVIGSSCYNIQVCRREAGMGLVPHFHNSHKWQSTSGGLRAHDNHHHHHYRRDHHCSHLGHQTAYGQRGMMDNGLAHWLGHDWHKILAHQL